MTMSTKIDDLPNEMYEMEEPSQQFQKEELEHFEPETNITMNIKKKVQFDDNVEIINKNDIWSYVKSEVTEENVLILIMLYVASINVINKQLRQVQFLEKFNSDLLINIVKIAIIFIAYVLIKRFVLPKIKL